MTESTLGNGSPRGALTTSGSTNDGNRGRGATIIAVPGQPTTGTDGPDVILGSDGTDQNKALRGDDLVCGRGDEIGAGAGADRIFAGGGRDLVRSKAGPEAEALGGSVAPRVGPDPSTAYAVQIPPTATRSKTWGAARVPSG
jgi:hypothetical protein